MCAAMDQWSGAPPAPMTHGHACAHGHACVHGARMGQGGMQGTRWGIPCRHPLHIVSHRSCLLQATLSTHAMYRGGIRQTQVHAMKVVPRTEVHPMRWLSGFQTYEGDGCAG